MIKSYVPVRITKGQQYELENIFERLPNEEKRQVMRMTLDILGWDVIITPRGYRLERQS